MQIEGNPGLGAKCDLPSVIGGQPRGFAPATEQAHVAATMVAVRDEEFDRDRLSDEGRAVFVE